MRGRLAILLLAALVLPLVGTAWWGYCQLRAALASEAPDDRLRDATQATLDAALIDLRTRLRDELGQLALRVAYLQGTDAASRDRAFAGVADADRPRWLGCVPDAPAAGSDLPTSMRAALAAELASDEPVRGWRNLPMPEGGQAACEVVVERCERGHLVAVQPLAAVVAHSSFADRLERAIVLPDGGTLPVGGSRPGAASAEPPLGPDEVARLCRQASADAADGDFGPAHRELSDGQIGALALPSPLGEPEALVVVRARDALVQPVLGHADALLAQSRVTVAWLAAAGVLLALAIGLLAPRFVWSNIRESTDFIFASVERLHELVSRIGAALAEQAGVLESLSAAVARLDTDSREIADTGRTLSHSAEQSEWVSQSGHQKAESAQRAVIDVRDGVDEIGRQMEELGRRCEAIGEILVYLDHLTSETSLVSINASIQAHGAAGSGQQLTAMAGEIQKLAELALGSTREIRQLVEEIQEASRAAGGAVKGGREQVERCLGAFEEVEQNFGRILRWVEDTKRDALGIEGSTARQSEALQSVVHDVAAIGQRSRETSANFDAVVDASNELAELGRHMTRTWRVG